MIKNLIFSVLVMGFTFNLIAQDYSNLDKIVLNEKDDYVKNENQVIECSDYLLNSPLDAIEKDLNRLRAVQFIMRWMEGTPDYTFMIDETIVKATKSTSSLLGIYFAAMSKFVLENKEKSGDVNEVKYNSFMSFISYCEDPVKNVKQNKTIKELIKAKNENTLKEYLKI